MTNVTVQQGQSLLDVCNQATGTLQNLMNIAVLNGKSITDFLTPGESVSVDNSDDLIDSNVVSYYTTNSITPGTVGDENAQVIGTDLIIPFLIE